MAFPYLLRSVKTVSRVYAVRQFAKHESLDESTYPEYVYHSVSAYPQWYFITIALPCHLYGSHMGD